MEGANSMPQDVPFDERLFESNDLLKQYQERSVSGRAVFSNLATQRSAEEEDLRLHSLKLQESLVAKESEVVSDDSIREMEDARADADRETLALLQAPVAPVAAGPILTPKASTNTLLIVILVIVCVIALLFVLGYFGQNWQVQRAAAAVTAPVRAAARPAQNPQAF